MANSSETGQKCWGNPGQFEWLPRAVSLACRPLYTSVHCIVGISLQSTTKVHRHELLCGWLSMAEHGFTDRYSSIIWSWEIAYVL